MENYELDNYNSGDDCSGKAEVKLAVKTVKFLDGLLDGECKSIVRIRAIIGAVALAFPLFGFDTIIYVIALWSTYYSISEVAGVKFSENFWSCALMGALVNVVVVFVLNLILDFIPLFGWIGMAIIGFVSIYLSGIGYITALKGFYGKKANVSLQLKK